MINTKPESIYIEERNGGCFYVLLKDVELIMLTPSAYSISIGFTSQRVLQIYNGSRFPNVNYNPGNDAVYVELHYADGSVEKPYPREHVNLAELYKKLIGKA